MLGDEALERFIEMKGKGPITCLNIGDAKNSPANKRLLKSGFIPTTVSLVPPADIVGDYLEMISYRQESIWCCHCLEHQRNPGLFLDRIFEDLIEGGLFAITVPPQKEPLAGGHVTIWNKNILLYQLVLSGFDCSDAVVMEYGYNISVIVRKKSIQLDNLEWNKHDLDRIKTYFPKH